MKKVKLLILSFYYEPDLCAGSFRTTALVNSLLSNSDNPVEIELITTLPNRYSSFSAKAKEFEERDGLTVHRVKLSSHSSGMKDQAIAYLSYFLKVMKITNNKEYDLVYGTSSRLMTAAVASWVARRKKAKLYLDIRDIFVDTIGDVMSPIWGKLFKLIEKWSFGRAHTINLVSEGFRDYFRRLLPGKRLTFFTNGIDDVFLDLKVESKKSEDILTILYAGNIGEGQGLHKIIPPLAKRLEGKVIFKVFGDGGRRSVLESELEAHNVQNVFLNGPIAREGLIEEYRNADILFLHLNDYQAFRKVLPSKLFEYGAVAKPILGGVAGYPAEFLKKEIAYSRLFNPCDPDDAVAAYEKIPLKAEERLGFKTKYSRKTIMEQMAKDIYNVAKNGVDE